MQKTTQHESLSARNQVPTGGEENEKGISWLGPVSPEQRRSGRRQRKVILLAKALVFLASDATLIQCLGMPAPHRAELAEAPELLHRLNLSWTMATAAYVIGCYEILATTWAALVTPRLAWAMITDFLLRFAWGPEPETFTLEELREMASLEEARKDKLRESQGTVTTSLIWRLQRAAAALGVNMAWFAYGQFGNEETVI
ncbi:hypothetical protein DL770_001326 [Monosporascus sp. CRB-9-2]|nr:hypothetical protein DL770_001326 [Monosporascus sp. CRB-9-2]